MMPSPHATKIFGDDLQLSMVSESGSDAILDCRDSCVGLG